MHYYSAFSILFVVLLIEQCSSITLTEVYNEMRKNHKDSVLTPSRSHPDYHRTKQREIIGSFRGKPIYNRQYSGFVDDNGVPVPVLPYAKNDDPVEAWRRG
ncbi:hypothetical protein L596_000023 [Steinernema carpocapsae]|nr:hypothetical protein L596_000023 [Steinernema carpocapsae]